jgi:hypothetical protein
LIRLRETAITAVASVGPLVAAGGIVPAAAGLPGGAVDDVEEGESESEQATPAAAASAKAPDSNRRRFRRAGVRGRMRDIGNSSMSIDPRG